VSHTPPTALVLLGGEPIELDEPAAFLHAAGWVVASPGVVVAADSGIDQAHRLGVRVDVAVGDFDSVSPSGLARAADDGAEIERHAAAKDATDLELALDAVAVRGHTAVLVVGGDGGRLDHLLANALVLASDRYSRLDITAVGRGGSRLHVVRRARTIEGTPGEYVSLLAVHGPAEDVRTDGLRYPLHGERLDPGSSRGVSNELLGARAEVRLGAGVLLAVLPGPDHLRDVP
jgi:thiamine pyrophosphokinase